MNLALDVLRARLLHEPPLLPLAPTRSEYDLDGTPRPKRTQALLPAAVLIPLVTRKETTVLFTERAAHLSRHAGQVSFPGGRAHEGDVSLLETALRETEEEIGIAASFVSIAGFLDAYETGTGYAILPVVGVLGDGFAVRPDANEVAEIFEVPLSFLLDPANRRKETREWGGRTRTYYAFAYEGHKIWGATAAMLVNFGERLAQA